MNLATDSTPALRRATKDAAPGARDSAKEAKIIACAANLTKAVAPVMRLMVRQFSGHGEPYFDHDAALVVGTDTYEHACYVLARILVTHSQLVAHNTVAAKK